LQEEKGFDSDKLSRLLNHQSGLLGVSGTSSDMRVLLGDPSEQAQFAIALFCQSVRKAIGAFATSLEGLKTLVFTAGIGEKSAEVREKICSGLSFLGIEIDKEANKRGEKLISKGKCRVLVIPTNEDLMLARYAYRVLIEKEGN